jgi:hypothetical protein
MDRAEWYRLIIVAVRQLADRSYQERAWLGSDATVISSAAEMCCRLCDDLQFPESLTTLGWTAAQRAAGLELMAAIDACDVADRQMSPSDVIDHPDWVRVRVSSQHFADLL